MTENKNTIYKIIDVFGLKQSGKSIFLKILQSKFENLDKYFPTGTNVHKMSFENQSLSVGEYGGSDILAWLKHKKDPPDGIVYVVNIDTFPDFIYQNNFAFEKLINTYIVKNPIKKLIPILIVGNKIDLVPNPDPDHVFQLVRPDRFPITYKIFLTSAVKNEGVTEAFRWLINTIKNGTDLSHIK